MRARLFSLPLVALVAASIDTVLVRLGRSHLERDASLFLEALVLWTVFALLALVPAGLSARFLRRRTLHEPTGAPEAPGAREPWAREALGLFGWTTFPVLAHQVLNSVTRIAQDVAGLRSPLPWLGILAIAAAWIVLGRILARALARTAWQPVAAGVTLVALAAGWWLPGAGGLEVHAPPGAELRPASAERPNLLLLVWDTTRAETLDAYGYERATAPNLTALSDAALLYEEARSVSTFTLSSHVSMLTGVFPSQHTTVMAHMVHNGARTPSVAALLQAAGYRTGAFVGTSVLRAETGIADGFEVYDDVVDPRVSDTAAWALVHDLQAVLALRFKSFRHNGRPHWFQDFQRPAPKVLARALAWIRRDDPRPWFCFVNMYDAHWPYLPGADGKDQLVRDYRGTLDGFLFRSDAYDKSLDRGVKGSHLGAEDKQHLVDLYAAELWELDREVDRFLGQLDLQAGRTAAVITSDHGEAFGEADHYEHSAILEPQVRVPLLVLDPTQRTGRRVPRRASGVDVATTLLSLAGLAPLEHMVGLDLTGTIEENRPILVEDLDNLRSDEADNQVALYRDQWKLVRTGARGAFTYELFDLGTDPTGIVDVAAQHADVRTALAAELDALRATWNAEGYLDRFTASAGVDNADALDALGYVETNEDRPHPDPSAPDELDQ